MKSFRFGVLLLILSTVFAAAATALEQDENQQPIYRVADEEPVLRGGVDLTTEAASLNSEQVVDPNDNRLGEAAATIQVDRENFFVPLVINSEHEPGPAHTNSNRVLFQLPTQ